ncbi:MAG: hypothetical protein Fur0021_37300 [Candidatus Promineifilaceae bacterium]
MRFTDRQKFTAYMQDEQPLKPANILNIVAINQGKRPLTMTTPQAAPLSPAQAHQLIAAGHVVVDARSAADYGAGHIPGAFNVQMSSSEFEQRVGWIAPPDAPIILVTSTAAEAQQCVFKMAFVGLDQAVVGFLDAGIPAWMRAGYPIATVSQIDVHTLQRQLDAKAWHVLDVREKDEWDAGHIAAAYWLPYRDMVPQLDRPEQWRKLPLSLDAPIAVTCATGKRSSTAISILLRRGYRHLYNVTGGMEAWRSAQFPTYNAANQQVYPAPH